MYLLIIIIPFLNFAIVGGFGRFLGNKGTYIITIFNMLLTLILSYMIFFEVMLYGSICFFKILS